MGQGSLTPLLFLSQFWVVDGMSLTGQIWEPRFREAKSHAQGHTGRISRTEAHTASGLNRSSYFENFHRIPYLPFLVCPRRVCTRAHVCVSLPELLVV